MKYWTKTSTILIFTIATFFSCINGDKTSKDIGLSKKDKKFVSRFNNQLLIKTVNQSLEIIKVKVKSEQDILSIEDSIVKPIVYNQFLSTKHMMPEHKKELFIQQVLPQILIAKYFFRQEKTVLETILNDVNAENEYFGDIKAFIKKQILKHDAQNTADLIQKLNTHPTSIILAQAAIESNWGSSLSYTEANNPFHILSVYKSEPRLKTFGEEGNIIFLKEYKYLPSAIIDYFININRQERFKEFRKMRTKTNDPMELAKYLENYSLSQDEKYVELLSTMIQQNGLIKYDNYRIDPKYILEISEKKIKKIIAKQTRRNKRIITRDSGRIKKITEKSIDIQYLKIDTSEDIQSVEDKYVIPHVYKNVVSLKHLPVNEKKEKFFDMLLPSVLVASFGIEETRKKIETIVENRNNGKPQNTEDSLFVSNQLIAWKAKDIDELLNRKMVTRPNSIMLAQAAIETGWGSSRFFIHANNTFGVWSFNKNESRIRALETRSGKPVYVKKYDDISESIFDYYKVIARGPYKNYRISRMKKDDPYEMVDNLLKYSERGQEYIDLIKNVMRESQLERYDVYQIDPNYINE